MQRHLRKLLPFFFLLLSVLLIGSPACMELRMQLHKFAVKQRLSQQRQTMLSFTANEWAAIKILNGHECKVNGKMFDISRLVKSENVVTVHGHYDHLEDELLREFLHFFEKDPSAHSKSAIVFFHFLFYEEHSIQVPSNTYDYSFCNLSPVGMTEPFLLNRDMEIDSPPPRI